MGQRRYTGEYRANAVKLARETTARKLNIFSVSKQGIEVCQFEKSGAQRYYPDSPLAEERQKLNRLMSGMMQAHNLYAEAKPVDIVGVTDFRLISSFGNYLIAAKLGKDNEIRFTTWSYDYDRKGVTLWHNL